MPESWSVFQPLTEEPDTTSPAYLAHKLLSLKDATPRLILANVASGPKQFKELKEGTGKPDGQLTRALGFLHEEGILVERLHARQAPAYKTHELGPKGILVMSMLQAFREAERSVEVAPVPSVSYVMRQNGVAGSQPVAVRATKVHKPMGAAKRKARPLKASKAGKRTPARA